MPLPSLFPERPETGYTATFDTLGRIRGVDLAHQKRIACLSQDGLALLQQRFVHHLTRVVVPKLQLLGTMAHVLEDAELQEEWAREDHEFLAPIELSTFVRRPAGSPLPPLFRRGDVDSSGNINLTDAIRILLYLFSGTAIDWPDAADVDSYGTVAIEDPILLLGYLFLGEFGVAPPGPLVCGQDAFPDDLPDCPPDLCPN